MFSRLVKFPTLNVNDIPISITNKTGELLSKNVFVISQPFIALFENEVQFFNESEPIGVNKVLRDNVDSVFIRNYYRDLSTKNKNIYFFRSWFRYYKDERLLTYYNVLENLNHPSTCNKTVAYMLRASEQNFYSNNDDQFITLMSKVGL